MTYGADPNAEPVGFRRLYDDVGIVDLDTPTELVDAGADRACGSSPGTPAGAPSQLDGEIDEGAWYVVPVAAAGRCSGADPERAVARRAAPPARASSPGTSTRPADPTLN